MKTKQVCFWRMRSDTRPDKVIVTRYRMTSEEALARDPAAVPAGGEMTLEVPETEEESLTALYSRGTYSPMGPPRA